jgi:hypothetical protein
VRLSFFARLFYLFLMLRLPIPLSRFQGSRQLGSLLSTGDEAASIGVATLGGLHSLEVEYLFGRPYIIARGLLSSPEAGGIRLKELYSSRFPTTMARDMFVENVMERLRTFTTLLLTAPSAIHVALLQCACENALRRRRPRPFKLARVCNWRSQTDGRRWSEEF